MEGYLLGRRDLLIFGLQIAAIFMGLILFFGFYRAGNNILPIAQYPDPVLRQIASPIDHIDDTIISLGEDIVTTLRYRSMTDFFLKRSMPKGLAAPQVGIPIKMIVCGLNGEAKVMINPEILERKGNYASLEGCLSVAKGKNRIIKRAAYVKLKYKGLDNRERVLIVRNGDAAILEHEIDHLNGILNIDIRADEEGRLLL